MKIILALMTVFLLLPVFAQDLQPLDCRKIDTVSKAQAFMEAHPQIGSARRVADLCDGQGALLTAFYLEQRELGNIESGLKYVQDSMKAIAAYEIFLHLEQ